MQTFDDAKEKDTPQLESAIRKVDLWLIVTRYLLVFFPIFVTAAGVAFYTQIQRRYLSDWERHAIDVAREMNIDIVIDLEMQTRKFSNARDWNHAEVRESLDGIATAYLRQIDVAQINIFSRDRAVVYSTKAGLAGRPSGKNEKLDLALAGQSISDLEEADDEHDFEDARHGEDLLETYVPMRRLDVTGQPTGKVVGAFEIYQRVTVMTSGLRQIAWIIAIGSVAILLLVGTILYGVYRRGLHVVRLERNHREHLEAELEQAVENLEETVSVRTTELRHEREILTTVLDDAPSAFVLLDAEVRILYASRQFYDLAGGDTVEARGKYCWEAWGCSTGCTHCVARDAVVKGVSCSSIESVDGGERWLEHVAVPVRAAGSDLRVIEMITDVTARRQTEDQLSRAARFAMAGEVAATVAHEVRNAATTTKLILQVWQDQAGESPDARSVEAALSSIERMDALVDHLLKLTRPGRAEVKPIDAAAVVRDALDLVRPEARRRGIRFVERDDSTTCLCQGDAALLTEALVNVLLNALQSFDGSGGGHKEVRVGVHPSEHEEMPPDPSPNTAPAPDDSFVLIEISDNGPGIPKEILTRVLEPFFTTRTKGTGLGLAIVRRVVEEHGGSISVNNRSEGGAVVRILLPRGNSA